MIISKQIKKELVFVQPRSQVAKDRFINKMNKLHSCYVKNRKDNKIFLESISGRYLFSMNENADDHWEIIR